MKLKILILLFIISSCSTTTSFRIPRKSKLFIENQQISKEELNNYTRNPFFWNVASGIPYRIERKGKVIDEGKIKSQFRVASVFWPPFAIIYWPLGFSKKEFNFKRSMSEIRPKKKYKKVKHRK